MNNFGIYTRLSYHSSAIEGNTITLPEVSNIFLERSLSGSHKSTREFYEIENRKQAFECLFDNIDFKYGSNT